jgi:hypothetical protein
MQNIACGEIPTFSSLIGQNSNSDVFIGGHYLEAHPATQFISSLFLLHGDKSLKYDVFLWVGRKL